jgi:hypothetical protein
METLLRQEHGDLRNALAAYNAGDPASPAGQQYASEILNLAGQPDTTVSGTGNITTTSASGPFPGGNLDPFNWIWSLFGGAQHAATQGINDLLGQITKDIGSALKKAWANAWKRFEPDFIRISLVLLGVLILYAGIQGFLQPNASPSAIIVDAARKSTTRANNTTRAKTRSGP